MAFKIKEGLTIDSTAVFDDSATLLVNAPTASAWETARTISLSGDATGSVSIDGSGNATLEVTVTGSTGGTVASNLTGNVLSTDNSLVLENGTDGTDAYLVGDVRATDGTTVILDVNDGTTPAVFTGNVTGDVTGNADTATALETARTFSLTGDVVATGVSFDGTGNVTLSTTIQPNSVALGTDTTGDYVADVTVTAGTGLSVTGTGEGASVVLAGVDATAASTAGAATKGVASFDSANFEVASGWVGIKAGGVANAELANDSVTIGSTEVVLGTTETAIAGLTQIDIDNIRIDGNTISSTDANGNVIIDPNGTGAVNVSSSKITNLAAPTANTDAATKEYVDTIASASLHYHDPVRVETPSALTATYANGTAGVGATLTGAQEVLVIDGVVLDLNDRVLVYNQTNAFENGIYEVTTLGVAGSVAWVLTRTADADSYNPSDPDALGLGDAFFVTGGNTGAGELYVMTTEGTITFGTTGITFSQIGSSQIYNAGDALSLDGVTFDVNVDDSTIEIFGDALRVKDGGISAAKLAANSVTTAKILDSNVTNAKLANSTITFSDGTTSDPVALGETFTITGGSGITTTVTANEITIATTDTGSSQDIVKTFAVSDVDGGGTYSETGSYTVSGNADTLTFESSTGIDIDIDETNGVIRVAGVDATTTTKGIAQFSADNFAVTGGVVTIKDDGIILGTETTGDYVATVGAGTSGAQTSSSGLTITGTGEGSAVTIAHADTSSVADLTAAANTFVDEVTFDTYGHVATIGTGTIDFNVADNYAFKTISVAGQNDVVADSNTDTLTLAASTGITITTNDGTDTITVLNSDRGSSQSIIKSVVVTDTPGGGTYNETGTYNVTGNTDSITFESGVGIDLDIDQTNGVIRVSAVATGDTFETVTDTVAGSATEVIDTFPIATYRSAKYYVQVDDGSSFQASEFMVIHNGTSVEYIEYGVVELGTAMGDLSAAINGANVEISFANASATAADVVIKRLVIEV